MADKYPILSTINYPSDLRKLDKKLLKPLCQEIRTFIVEQLANNPGHLASSLGVVELTVALHYVFETPEDRIIWDVGHQAYGHKILTGRREKFSTNRKFKGLSGFPSPKESEYDELRSIGKRRNCPVRPQSSQSPWRLERPRITKI